MRRSDITPGQLFELADRVSDPVRELDLISNIDRYVTDPHRFAMAYANYAQTVHELCTGSPEPVSTFLQRWPHRRPELL